MSTRRPLTALLLPTALLASGATADPPTLVWESVISVSDEFTEGAREMAVDAEGAVFVLGDLAVEQDFFVAKLSPDGELLWQQVIGGSGLDNASDIAVDGDGDVHVVGRTLSDDFPTLNAYQSDKNGPSDGFLLKLDGDDGGLLRSTYFGGSRAEWASGLALGADGSIAVVGRTDSIDFPTVDPIQSSLTLIDCFCDDLFIARFDPAVDEVLFGTYLGGTYDEWGGDVAMDAAGNLYATGRTRSADFPTANAVQPVMGGGEYDAVVVKIAPDHTLVYSTYLGGEDWELVAGIDCDDSGAAYVAGSTRSITFPTTSGALQETFAGGINACGGGPFQPSYNCEDWYVTKLAADGTMAWSTYLGGSGTDEPRNIVVDGAGRAHVIGYTVSANFPGGAPGGEYVAMRMHADGSDADFLASQDCPNINTGGAIAVQGSSLYVAAKSGTIDRGFVTYDSYVARYADETALQDLDGDGTVGFSDLVILLGDWGPCAGCPADFDDDGLVGLTDLLALLASWGPA